MKKNLKSVPPPLRTRAEINDEFTRVCAALGNLAHQLRKIDVQMSLLRERQSQLDTELASDDPKTAA